MPLAFVLIGVLFLTAAVRGNKCNGQQCSDMLFQTLKSDFTGPGNFLYWGIALWIIGAVGYYKPLKPLSNAFLGLVIIVLFLSNRGFFQSFMEQISATQSSNSNLGSGTASNSSGDPISSILSTINNVGGSSDPVASALNSPTLANILGVQ